MKNITHGGARKGAGRKPKEPTVTIRVPISLVPKIESLIEKHKRNKERKENKDNFKATNE